MELPILLVMGGVLLIGLALWWRRRSGVPAGTILSQDTGAEPGQLLRSARYGLYGRPDYLVRDGRQVIPVELKPSQGRAYPAAIMQLMAYCLLVEEHYGRPSHGVLVLQDGPERIAYTDARRAELLAILAEMRTAGPVPPRSHRQAPRCRSCAFAPVCSQALP